MRESDARFNVGKRGVKKISDGVRLTGSFVKGYENQAGDGNLSGGGEKEIIRRKREKRARQGKKEGNKQRKQKMCVGLKSHGLGDEGSS